MANYVLGPSAARRLQEMMRGRMVSGRIEGDAAHVVDEGGFEHPYKLTYAASAGAVDGETGEADGAWIIWLPDGCLVIDGETVDLTANLTAANNYPAGWYDLTDIFDGTDPDEFDLYLDASKDDPKFVTAQEDAENPVLIAKVNGKAVKGVVESALVFSKGGNKKPFDIELDTTQDPPVKKVVRCHFRNDVRDVTLQDFPLSISSACSLVLRLNIPQDAEPSDPSGYDQYWSLLLKDGNTPAPSGLKSYDIKIYDFDADGNVLVDYRDADVNSDAFLVDNNTITAWGDTEKRGGALHLFGFYGTERDLSSAPSSFEVLVRTEVNNQQILCYLDSDALPGGGGVTPQDVQDKINDALADFPRAGMFAWTPKTRTMGPGGCMVGRKWIDATGTGSGKQDGFYSLEVTIAANGSATAAVVTGAAKGASPTSTKCWIPIYQISNGEISADYRGAFVVPAYD